MEKEILSLLVLADQYTEDNALELLPEGGYIVHSQSALPTPRTRARMGKLIRKQANSVRATLLELAAKVEDEDELGTTSELCSKAQQEMSAIADLLRSMSQLSRFRSCGASGNPLHSRTWHFPLRKDRYLFPSSAEGRSDGVPSPSPSPAEGVESPLLRQLKRRRSPALRRGGLGQLSKVQSASTARSGDVEDVEVPVCGGEEEDGVGDKADVAKCPELDLRSESRERELGSDNEATNKLSYRQLRKVKSPLRVRRQATGGCLSGPLAVQTNFINLANTIAPSSEEEGLDSEAHVQTPQPGWEWRERGGPIACKVEQDLPAPIARTSQLQRGEGRKHGDGIRHGAQGGKRVAQLSLDGGRLQCEEGQGKDGTMQRSTMVRASSWSSLHVGENFLGMAAAMAWDSTEDWSQESQESAQESAQESDENQHESRFAHEKSKGPRDGDQVEGLQETAEISSRERRYLERENLWETMSATSKEKSVMDSVMDSGAALRSDLRSQLQGHVGKGEEGMEESLSLSAETDIVAREAIREEKEKDLRREREEEWERATEKDKEQDREEIPEEAQQNEECADDSEFDFDELEMQRYRAALALRKQNRERKNADSAGEGRVTNNEGDRGEEEEAHAGEDGGVRIVMVGGRNDFFEVPYVDFLVEEVRGGGDDWEAGFIWKASSVDLLTARAAHGLVLLPQVRQGSAELQQASFGVDAAGVEGLESACSVPAPDPYAGMGRREREATMQRDKEKERASTFVYRIHTDKGEDGQQGGCGVGAGHAALTQSKRAVSDGKALEDAGMKVEGDGTSSCKKAQYLAEVADSFMDDDRAAEEDDTGNGNGGVTLLVVGGFSDSRHLNSTEIVTLPQDIRSVFIEGEAGSESNLGTGKAMRSREGPKMDFKRSGVAVAVLGGSVESGVQGIYACGGFDGKQASKLVEVLAISCKGKGSGGQSSGIGTWREVHMMHHARYSAAIATLPGEKEGGVRERIGVFGGFDGDNILSTVEVFTPHADAACSGGYGSWHKVAAMPRPRMACGCCIYRGKVVLVGGGGRGCTVLKSVDIWDPITDCWDTETKIADMPKGRKECTAFVLADRIWVVGGSDATGWLDSCIIYDETIGAWRDGPSLGTVRAAASCLVL